MDNQQKLGNILCLRYRVYKLPSVPKWHFLIFFQESESMAESQGYRKNWGFLGGMPASACVQTARPVPLQRKSASTDLPYGLTQGRMVSQMVSPTQRRTHKWHHLFQGHTHRGRKHPASFVPTPTLTESCFALWQQVFQICQSRNLGGSSSPFPICIPTSFWALDSSSRKQRKWQCLPPQVAKCKGPHTASSTITLLSAVIAATAERWGLQTQRFCLAPNSE